MRCNNLNLYGYLKLFQRVGTKRLERNDRRLFSEKEMCNWNLCWREIWNLKKIRNRIQLRHKQSSTVVGTVLVLASKLFTTLPDS